MYSQSSGGCNRNGEFLPRCSSHKWQGLTLKGSQGGGGERGDGVVGQTAGADEDEDEEAASQSLASQLQRCFIKAPVCFLFCVTFVCLHSEFRASGLHVSATSIDFVHILPQNREELGPEEAQSWPITGPEEAATEVKSRGGQEKPNVS